MAFALLLEQSSFRSGEIKASNPWCMPRTCSVQHSIPFRPFLSRDWSGRLCARCTLQQAQSRGASKHASKRASQNVAWCLTVARFARRIAEEREDANAQVVAIKEEREGYIMLGALLNHRQIKELAKRKTCVVHFNPW